MEQIKIIQEKIDKLNYGDSRVFEFSSNYFGDETKIRFEGIEHDEIILFLGCYKIKYEHVKNYDKMRPVREMTVPQIPYFLQDISLSFFSTEGLEFICCEIDMFPLNVEIICQGIEVL